MSSFLTTEEREQLLTILGDLVRAIQHGSILEDSELKVLLASINLQNSPDALDEVRLWRYFLLEYHKNPTSSQHLTTLAAFKNRMVDVEFPITLALRELSKGSISHYQPVYDDSSQGILSEKSNNSNCEREGQRSRDLDIHGWENFEPLGSQRSLPVYFLIDTSSRMDGVAIEAVHNDLEQFKNDLGSDPFLRDTIKVGIIPFSSTAILLDGTLTSINDFQVPNLVAKGVTRLDLAFEVLLDSMERDVIHPEKGKQKGDWRPIVFVLINSEPTNAQGYFSDEWKDVRTKIIDRPSGQIKPAMIVACGSQTGVNSNTLKAISTGYVYRTGIDQAIFKTLFTFITRSLCINQPAY